MRTTDWDGLITAVSSIAHGGEDRGNLRTLRHEQMIGADGKPRLRPLISGNAIKGELRRIAARLYQHQLVGDGKLPFRAVNALRTGGMLTETKTHKEVLTGERQAVLRDTIPVLGVFGVSGGGRIMRGRLYVDKAVPLARETAHLAPYYSLTPNAADLPAVQDLISEEFHARHPDADTTRATFDGETAADGNPMFWWTQTFCAGTQLMHAIRLEDATAVETAFFTDVLATFAHRGRVGGQQSRGLGRTTATYTATTADSAGAPADPEPANWRQHVTEHGADLAVERLGWL